MNNNIAEKNLINVAQKCLWETTAANRGERIISDDNISHNKEMIMKDTLVSGRATDNSLSHTHTH